MNEFDEPLSTGRSGEYRLAILPRDPDRAYVFWEWPDPGRETGELTVFVEKTDKGREVVDRYEVDDPHGGRFVSFGRSGVLHRCRLEWGEGRVEWSRPLRAPRRQPGDESPKFVRVRTTGRGLVVQPTEHDHPVHGHFPAGRSTAPSSTAFGVEPDTDS